LPEFIIEAIGGDVPAEVKLSGSELQQWEKVVADNMQALGESAPGGAPMVHLNGNVVYYGKSPSKPSIGDVRVTLTKIEPSQISIIAKVNGGTFEKFTAENGRTFSPVRRGTVTAEAMFSEAHLDSMLWLWALRLIGFLLAIAVCRLNFDLQMAFFKLIPFLRGIAAAGIKSAGKFMGGVFGIVMGGVWTFLVIGVAWIQYNPSVSVVMLALIIAGIWYLNAKGEKGN